VYPRAGASSGIGAALARQLAKRGARLILASRRLDKLEEVKASLAAPESDISTLELDVGNVEEAKRKVKSAGALLGPIDVLVNNAGISTRALAEDVSLDVVEVCVCVVCASSFVFAVSFALWGPNDRWIHSPASRQG